MQQPDTGMLSHRFRAMGCPCELRFLPPPDGNAKALARRLRGEVERLEAKYSRYRDDSVLSHINRQAGRAPLEVDEETAGLLDYAQTCYEQSEGRFDISAGILRRAWNFRDFPVDPPLPDRATLQALLARVGWHRAAWRRPHLHLPLAEMEIDLGGLVKEYAADRGANLALQLGIAHGLVDLGGDIRLIGPRPDGAPWTIGIRNPANPTQPMAEIELAEGALATSGDYERYLEIKGKRYSHILNPFTGWPIEGLHSVSVAAPQCLIAGTAATIAMLKGSKGKAWLDHLGLPNLRMDQRGELSGTLQTTSVTKVHVSLNA